MDILEKAKKKKPERTLVMFELPSSNMDYYSNRTTYKEEFITFLNSIGLDAETGNVHLSEFTINGMKVDADFTKTSTMAQNQYTKVRSARKLRQVIVYTAYKKALCTIPVNKPIDKGLLLKRIDAGLKAKQEFIKSVGDREQQKIDMFTALFNRYRYVPGFTSVEFYNDQLMVKTQWGGVKVGPNGDVSGFKIQMPPIETEEEFTNMLPRTREVIKNIDLAKRAIQKVAKPFTGEMQNGSVGFNGEGAMFIR